MIFLFSFKILIICENIDFFVYFLGSCKSDDLWYMPSMSDVVQHGQQNGCLNFSKNLFLYKNRILILVVCCVVSRVFTVRLFFINTKIRDRQVVLQLVSFFCMHQLQMKIHWHSYYNYNAYLFNCIRNVILETQICGIHSSTNESWVVFHAGYHYSQLMAMITWAKKKFKQIYQYRTKCTYCDYIHGRLQKN